VALTPRNITIPDANGDDLVVAGYDDGSGGWLQKMVAVGADGTAVAVNGSGQLETSAGA